MFFPVILYFEIEPLNMASSVGINSKKKIILARVDLDDCIEISWLKIAIESGLLLFSDCRVHSFEDSWYFWFKVAVKFSEVCCHMNEVPVDHCLMLELIPLIYLGLHFEAAFVSVTQINNSHIVSSSKCCELVYYVVDDLVIEVEWNRPEKFHFRTPSGYHISL